MIGRLADRFWVRILRIALRRCSNRAAWRHFQIERGYWTSPEGIAMIARLQQEG